MQQILIQNNQSSLKKLIKQSFVLGILNPKTRITYHIENQKQKKTYLSDYQNQSDSLSRSEIQRKLIIFGMRSTSNKTNDKKPSQTILFENPKRKNQVLNV